VGRCESCPASYDEAVFEALRDWRSRVSGSLSVPAYVVFTDATLTAIAETRPDSTAALAQISGVGVRKLEQYGLAVLRILGGDDPAQVAEQTTAASGSGSPRDASGS
jgi:DNA helicase-2/ATP-dependent DNA helicase PcrA